MFLCLRSVLAGHKNALGTGETIAGDSKEREKRKNKKERTYINWQQGICTHLLEVQYE